MQLPNNEVGISDILDYRECPQRFAYAMQRHLPMPDRFKLYEGEKANPQHRESYAGEYGSAIHDCIEVVEKTQCSDDEAVDAVWPKYQHWLEVEDQDRLKADLETWRSRNDTGFRVLGTELELRAPLFVHEGEMIFFRGRIDVLYQHLQNAGYFFMRDYKSSRWPRSEEEVHKDPQQWAYNWLVHETYPECETLIQMYDQLRFGDIPTQKSAAQRQQIKNWIIRQVKAILNDQHYAPKSNDWCYTCPLVMDCRVTHMAPDFWLNRLAALVNEEKQGRKLVTSLKLLTEDHAGLEIYTEQLPKAKVALKAIERFVEVVERTLKELPADERRKLGYDLAKPRELDRFPATALRQIHQEVGDDFYHLIGLTKKAVEDFYGGEDGGPKDMILELAEKKQTAPSLKALKKG